MPVLESIVGFSIGILGNYVATATQPPFQNPWQQRLEEELAVEGSLRAARTSYRSLREEVRRACRDLSQNRAILDNLGEQERQIWLLLSDPRFQESFADWLTTGSIDEGAEIHQRLEGRMEGALVRAGATPEQIEHFKAHYFEALERAIFSDPVLAAWRHQLSLDYLREQVAAIRAASERAAGIYSPAERADALKRYADEALRAWDIVDLSNLPEGDVHIATQKLLLRQLYMPLRVNVEISRERADDEEAFTLLEQRRTTRRMRAAGRIAFDEEPAEEQLAVEEREQVPIGHRLRETQRLVVLGDPGGGKTTLLRWMASAYLLLDQDQTAYEHIPDVETLPDRHWLPVLIRCRDIGAADLCRSFADFLAQHLRKSELRPDEAAVMAAVILERIAAGEVLLLVDGLDEITDPQVRVQFCQELERTAARYPDTTIIVTSRIVGYRDMPYRMGNGFEHAVIADLSREDRDLFAERWVEVTEQHQTSAERQQRTQELIEALHSSDRIERLTGNPMLLTTLTLIKRKVGKLPNRRNKLYSEAVAVLLNWNPRHYRTIDETEAVPQLAYLAYEMCRRGVQRLTEDEVLDLLDRLRQDYPNVRAIRQRSSHEFLAVIEARSSILIKSGGQWLRQQNSEQALWEFRHLTFQEYLAARAMIDGRYPDRDRAKSLAEAVAPLAGFLQESSHAVRGQKELEVTDSWQEALRLLVADCNDDDVDEVLLAIATPLEGEDAERTARPRAVLAARCLADEPNVSEDVAQEIIARFIAQISEGDAGGFFRTSVDNAALEVRRSVWAELLKRSLMCEFFERTAEGFQHFGGLWGMVNEVCAPDDPQQFLKWYSDIAEQLHRTNKHEIAAAACVIMGVAFKQKAVDVLGVVPGLLNLLKQDEPLPYAGAWALVWLCRAWGIHSREVEYVWQPNLEEVQLLIAVLRSNQHVRSGTVRRLVSILGQSRHPLAIDPLLEKLHHANSRVRQAAVKGLGRLGDTRAVEPLIERLNDEEEMVWQEVVHSLVLLDDVRAVKPLIERLSDPEFRVRQTAARALGQLGDKRAVEPLIEVLKDSQIGVRQAAARALSELGDERAVEPLISRLSDHEDGVRNVVVQSLGKIANPRSKTVLNDLLHSSNPEERIMGMRGLAEKYDPIVRLVLFGNPWLDPREMITEVHVAETALQLGMSQEEVRLQYEQIAPDFLLKLEWVVAS